MVDRWETRRPVHNPAIISIGWGVPHGIHMEYPDPGETDGRPTEALMRDPWGHYKHHGIPIDDSW